MSVFVTYGSAATLITTAPNLASAISSAFISKQDGFTTLTATLNGGFSQLVFAVMCSYNGAEPSRQVATWDVVASQTKTLMMSGGSQYQLVCTSFAGGTDVSVTIVLNSTQSLDPTVTQFTNSKAQAVSVIDQNGTQITNFGGSAGLTDAQLRATPVPVSGTFFQTTQPVSLTSLPALAAGSAVIGHIIVDTAPTTAVTGPLTDAQLRAVPVPISGTVTANVGTGGTLATAAKQPALGTAGTPSTDVISVQGVASGTPQPISGTVTANIGTAGTLALDATLTGGTQKAIVRAGAKGVTVAADVTSTAEGADHQAIDVQLYTGGAAIDPRAISSLPALPAGTNVIGHVINDASSAVIGHVIIDSGSTTAVTGTVGVTESGTWTVQPGNTANTTPWLVSESAAILAVTAVGASGAAVTLTLPAVASQFHYITHIEILKYAVGALTGGATPVTVTTTNLPGTPAFTFETAGAIGTIVRTLYEPTKSLRSSTVNTATTIVCPATTNVIWRVNVWYLAAV
jgi:hypothetical protein